MIIWEHELFKLDNVKNKLVLFIGGKYESSENTKIADEIQIPSL